jgi:hypothetical protein
LSALEQPRFTLDEWSRIVSDPTRDNAYQRISRLGGSVRDYLAWKTPSASERTLVIYEGYLAALCIWLAQNGNPDLTKSTPPCFSVGWAASTRVVQARPHRLP